MKNMTKKMNVIVVPSVWGTEVQQKHITVREENHKLVVLFPGKNYPCDLPLLYYAGNTAIQHNYDVLRLEYGYQAARTDLDMNQLSSVIDECYESVQQVINNYEQVIFISKSLGTVIAGEVHRRLQTPIKHVFLTPLVKTIPYMNSSEGTVIYGSNDPAFTKEDAAQIESSQKVVQIDGADHGLETGDVEENLAHLKVVVDVYREVFSSMYTLEK